MNNLYEHFWKIEEFIDLSIHYFIYLKKINN